MQNDFDETSFNAGIKCKFIGKTHLINALSFIINSLRLSFVC